MKLLHRLRREFSSQTTDRAAKQVATGKPTKASLAFLPKVAPMSLLKESLR